ncbi:MAG TPA: molybdopterin dinucleotide binding domain-containing protein [Anaerolineae bacterium]
MPEMRLLLITGRSLKQGTGLNTGKGSADYLEAVGTVELSGGDLARLGALEGDDVRLRNRFGQVTVRCRKADLPDGMAFMAYGPATSILMGSETGASGMPDSKHLEVDIERLPQGGHNAG